MIKNLYFSLVILFLLANTGLFAQNKCFVLVGDSSTLNINQVRGSIQWQQSSDHMQWEAIQGADSTSIQVVPAIEKTWLRAAIQEDNCPVFFEREFEIQAFDPEVFGFVSKSITLSGIEGATIDTAGVITCLASDSVLALVPGDHIYPSGTEEFILQVDALIVVDGLVTIYTSSAGIRLINRPLALGNLIYTNVSGIVTDTSDTRLVAVLVRIGDLQTYTDHNGFYFFENVPVFEKLGVVKTFKSGYIDQVKSFFPLAGGNSVNIKLNRGIVYPFTGATGGTLSANGVEITLPPNAFVTATGNLPMSSYSLTVGFIDPARDDFSELMPGELLGAVNGQELGLISFGMFSVNHSPNIKLAPGVTAQIAVSVSEEIIGFAPDSIQLWSLDEERGYWNIEGMAYLENGRYVAEVSHFSFWNVDIGRPVVWVTGNVSNENGLPINNIVVSANSELNEFYNLTTINYNSLGDFVAVGPTEGTLELEFNYYCAGAEGPLVVHSELIQTGFQNIQRDITIDPANLQDFKMLSGTVVDCDSNVLPNTYVLVGNTVISTSAGNYSLLACGDIEMQVIKPYPNLEMGPVQQFLYANMPAQDVLLQLCDGSFYLTDSAIDNQGNMYPMVLIGDQWWMAENLKTTDFNDGSPIAQNLAGPISTPFWAYINNDSTFNDIHGKLYNWHVAVDPRGVCPIGLRVPTYTDFLELTAYLNSESASLKAVNGWNELVTEATNRSGFNGRGHGMLIGSSGNISGLGERGIYWTTRNWGSYGGALQLDYNTSVIPNTTWTKTIGNAIRCIRDF